MSEPSPDDPSPRSSAPGSATRTPPHSPREALVLLAASCALAALVRGVPEGAEGTFLKAVKPTLWFLAWVLPAYVAVEFRRRDPLVVHGVLVRPERAASSLGVALALLPLYVLGVWLASGSLPARRPPLEEAGWLFFSQVLFTAFPEEVFFRGALQPSLLPSRPHVSIVLVSAVFALAHVVFQEDHAAARLLVFFPSLVFGWLRLRTGSVLPGIFFHALCNVVQLELEKALERPI
ncbi:CPBP family intramembrane metalloprotease [bacterium]|nr:CPBP family intramembrane metalloprotease [bacterium]